MILRVSICAWLAMLASCTTSPHANSVLSSNTGSSCGQLDGEPELQAELFFGRDIEGHATVSDAQWSEFLRDEVTPRFPEGLSQLAAMGQWRDSASGEITREPSFIVRIIAEDTPRTLTHLTQIRAAYVERFHQQSVGLTLSPVCASF